jgi:putative transposase
VTENFLCVFSDRFVHDKQETGRWKNNRAENSHPLPGSGLFANHEKGPFRRRERAMQRFRSMRTLQKIVAVHASVHNHFNQERHLYSRSNFKLNRTAALAEWRQLGAAKGQLHCPCGDWFALV